MRNAFEEPALGENTAEEKFLEAVEELIAAVETNDVETARVALLDAQSAAGGIADPEKKDDAMTQLAEWEQKIEALENVE